MRSIERRFDKKTLMLIALPIVFACGPKVMVPPKVDLKTYDRVGMIEFSSNARGELHRFVSQRFLQSVQSAQPEVRFLELGTKEDVLRSVRRRQVDVKTLKAIGKKHGVDAVITGHLDVTDVKPKVRLSAVLESMQVRADVEATLTARLFETDSGATLWTNSAHRKETVAHVTLISGELANFDARDPESAYGKLVHKLVKNVTRDFRVRYVRQ